jgi:formylmethanofuran dehydrogenase subunit B
MSDTDLSSAATDDGGTTQPAVIEPVTCVACGCLCDDLVVTREEDKLVRLGNGCPLSESWFLADRAQEANHPVAVLDGRSATVSEAVARAAELLASASAPAIVGLTGSTNQTVAAAVRLADLIGALVDPANGPGALAQSLAQARTGRISATLGEVKNRSDVVVFWGADPVRSHPRHWERYSVMPAGRFVPKGRTGRTVIVVDDNRTATAELADHFVEISRAHEFEVLWTLRALIKGLELDARRVLNASGIELQVLQGLAAVLRGARHGALFHTLRSEGRTLTESAAVIEAINGLVRELNSHTRFVILGMGEPGNAPGAGAVLTWQTGFPAAVDLAAGYPVSLPGVSTAVDRLKRCEADVVVVVGASGMVPSDPGSGHCPRIIIAPPGPSNPGLAAGDIRCHAATPGLDELGTVVRTDGVALPLRPVREARFPTERQWLEAIILQLRSLESI